MEAKEVEVLYVRDVYGKLARQEEFIYDHLTPTSSFGCYDRRKINEKPWPIVQKFLNKIPNGSLIIDAGCGTIKQNTTGSFRIGFDNCSDALLRSKYSGYHDLVIADGLYLPFRSDCVDFVLCVSVLHHLSLTERRLKLMKNLTQIMLPNAQMIISVWAEEQPFAKFPAQDILVPWNLHEIPKNGILPLVSYNKDSTREQRVIESSIPIEICDTNKFTSWMTHIIWKFQCKLFNIERQLPVAIPQFLREKKVEGIAKIVSGVNRWSPVLGNHLKLSMICIEELYATELSVTLIEEAMEIALSTLQKVIYYRYYHVFRQNELESLIEECKTLKLLLSVYESANWFAIVERHTEHQ